MTPLVASLPPSSETPPISETRGSPKTAPRSLLGHRSAYLLGIGGVGMAGAAELLRARGMDVAGSDAVLTRRTERMERLGIHVDEGGDAAAIPSSTTLVVASAAIPASHPQLAEARRRGLPVWKYAECLGALMEGRIGIAVAGCHGKTTTSALVATSLWRAGRDPTFVIGGDVLDVGASARPGRGEHFVAEACEYDRSFHRLRPTIAVVTNIDADHLDYYRDLEEIRESFREFARLLPPHGVLVVHEDHAAAFGDGRVLARIETYGLGATADWRAVELGWDVEAGVNRFRVVCRGRVLGDVAIPLPGRHSVLNATGAIAALRAAGMSFAEAAAGLRAFGGVGRRLEPIADEEGILVLDDYGHHPAEIRAVIRALRTRHLGRRLIVAFQPHQASRTRLLMEEFGGALSEADEAWIGPIYLARDSEEDRRRVSAEDVALAIRAHGGRALAFSTLAEVEDHAAASLEAGDVFVTMGAGNVDEVAHGLALRLR